MTARLRAGLLRGGALLLLDVIAPIYLLIRLVMALHPTLVAHLDTRLGAPTLLNPSDSNGTIWFFWWFEQAWSAGKDLLYPDVVCAPTIL